MKELEKRKRALRKVLSRWVNELETVPVYKFIYYTSRKEGCDMDMQALAKRIYNASYLTGEFTLRSGQKSGEYFDKYLYEADPVLLRDIAKEMAKLIPEGTEVLAGLEMGGIPLATALSLESGIMTAYVRKKAKNYGTCRLAEGADINGRNVCVIEDNVTTGGQIVESVRELRSRGAKVRHILCAVLRDPAAVELLTSEGLSLIPLFTMEQLKTAGDVTFWDTLDRLIASSEIVIDRPKGTRHPKYPDMIYEVDYGYLEGTTSMDGGGIDLWRGSEPTGKLDAIICIVDLWKKDSEIKLLIGCTEAEKEAVMRFHNGSDAMKGVMTKR